MLSKNPLLSAAMSYLRAGMSVIPATWPIVDESGAVRCSCARPNCPSPGKHPQIHWQAYQRTKPSAQQLVSWWSRWPDANVGIPTGAISGLVVIDIDPDHGGDESLADIEREFGQFPPEALRVVTGGGGLHIWMPHPGGEIPSRAGWRPGIDIRADGGQVIAPPSRHASGREYAFELSTPFSEQFRTAKWQPGLVEQLRGPVTLIERHNLPIEELITQTWPQGQRNVNLTRVIGWLVSQNRDNPAAVMERALEINQQCCRPPLETTEVLTILSSIWRRDSQRNTAEQIAEQVTEQPDVDVFTLTPEQRAQALAQVWHGMGFPLVVERLIAYESADGIEWAIVLADGREFAIGSDILSMATIHRHIANNLGIVLPVLKPADWRKKVAQLLKLAERIEALPQGAEQVNGWVDTLEWETIENQGQLPDADVDLESATDALRNGSVVLRTINGTKFRWISLGRLRLWLEVREGQKLTHRQLAVWLRKAGWEPATWNAPPNGFRMWRQPWRSFVE